MNMNQNSNNNQLLEGDVQSILRRKMFVGGLSNGINEEDLIKYFGQYGEVVQVEVIKSGEGKSRGFGFVTFADEVVVHRLLGGEHVIKARKLDCRTALLPGTKGEGVTFQPAKLFVGGLSSDTTPDILVNYFIQFGAVARAEVIQDHMTDKSRGFGFVIFEDSRCVQAVLNSGTFHLINSRYCEVKQAIPRQVAQAAPQPSWSYVPATMIPSTSSAPPVQLPSSRPRSQAQQQYLYVPCIPVPSGSEMMYPSYLVYTSQAPVPPPLVVPRASSQPLPLAKINKPVNSRTSLP